MSELRGRRVVVTRAPHQAEELAAPLRAQGAEVILLPMISIAPPLDKGPLLQAAAEIDAFDWLIFTSVNAVTAFRSALGTVPSAVRPKVAAIGEGTAERARALGFQIALLASKSVSEGLAADLAAAGVDGKNVLIPSAAAARDVLPNELNRLGARVRVVEAYRNVMPEESRDRAAIVFSNPLPDWITFASPSAVDNLVALIGHEIVAQCRLASIGPVTSAALRNHGLRPTIEANPHTILAMVAGMA